MKAGRAGDVSYDVDGVCWIFCRGRRLCGNGEYKLAAASILLEENWCYKLRPIRLSSFPIPKSGRSTI